MFLRSKVISIRLTSRHSRSSAFVSESLLSHLFGFLCQELLREEIEKFRKWRSWMLMELTYFWRTFILSIFLRRHISSARILAGIILFRQWQLHLITRRRDFVCLLFVCGWEKVKKLENRLKTLKIPQRRKIKKRNQSDGNFYNENEKFWVEQLREDDKWSTTSTQLKTTCGCFQLLPIPSLSLSSDSSDSEPSSDSLSDSFHERSLQKFAEARRGETRDENQSSRASSTTHQH